MSIPITYIIAYLTRTIAVVIVIVIVVIIISSPLTHHDRLNTPSSKYWRWTNGISNYVLLFANIRQQQIRH